MSATLMNLDYESRGLDICQFCAMKYNVGERIPRILVHCGHTLCTNCIQQLHHKDRVRCPICRKLIKQLESAERLPLNINILYEIVEKDKQLTIQPSWKTRVFASICLRRIIEDCCQGRDKYFPIFRNIRYGILC